MADADDLRAKIPDLDGAPYYGDYEQLARDLQRLQEFEERHEATDAHLYRRCGCEFPDDDHDLDAAGGVDPGPERPRPELA